MTEQTPNEPRDLVSQLRSRLWNSDVDERLGREAADAIEALRARPTPDRGPLTNADEIKLYHVIEKVIVDELHVQKMGASDEVTSAAVDWFNSAILAAVGQDTPEPEWTDPEPYLGLNSGRRYSTPGGSVAHRPRTREQHDAEQGT